jgi:hypothetical protein
MNFLSWKGYYLGYLGQDNLTVKLIVSFGNINKVLKDSQSKGYTLFKVSKDLNTISKCGSS